MNLEQIAKLSGISRSTVSRVVNNDPNVSTVTREKVLQALNQNKATSQATPRRPCSIALGGLKRARIN